MSVKDNLDDQLVQLQLLLVKELTRRIENEDATTADLNTARQLLRDNDINGILNELSRDKESPYHKLALAIQDNLPVVEEPGDERVA